MSSSCSNDSCLKSGNTCSDYNDLLRNACLRNVDLIIQIFVSDIRVYSAMNISVLVIELSKATIIAVEAWTDLIEPASEYFRWEVWIADELPADNDHV